MMKHKHYDYIVAWAEGKEIQCKDLYGNWITVLGATNWSESNEYRIKPEPKPDWFKHIRIETLRGQIHSWDFSIPEFANLRITFDGETGNLKSAEVI